MAMTDDLVDFDLIETHKENIQQLPGGRSARQLVSLLSPVSSGKSATFDETKTLNDAIRQEYEIELQSINDSDDPLDIYDRYVKWTLNAYPSAQSTPQSQLLPLLERATKAFLTSNDYKNDPRYLKLWLHYIRLFSDAPRETFAFLARHSIGEHLALFYEEFASWLENAGRWSQADEVYNLGIQREARPAERLMRKYNQFQQRFDARPQDANEPTSPALPRVRAALAAKVDPFAPAAREETQPQRQPPAAATKPKKAKMAIFSDSANDQPPPTAGTPNGWDSIGSMKERKKENTIEARPWAGETLKAGKKAGTGLKMEVFRDTQNESKKYLQSQPPTINPKTGRPERVFVNMHAVYAEDGNEYSFEELCAIRRGFSGRDWKRAVSPATARPKKFKSNTSNKYKSKEPEDLENITTTFEQKLDLNQDTAHSQDSIKEGKSVRQKKIKVREVKQEAQTIKARLDSPSKPRIKKKHAVSAEPTMTINTKAAHNDVYEMFNNAERDEPREDTQSGAETDFDEDNFTVGGITGPTSVTNSEYGDDTAASIPSLGLDETGPSPWSDFTQNKSVQKLIKNASAKASQSHAGNEDFLSQDQAQDDFDTMAIAALAGQDFGELDTMAIAKIAGGELDGSDIENEVAERGVESQSLPDTSLPAEVEVHEKPKYVPLPPEDYEPTPVRPYRDPHSMAQNKLPFMTPIVERTESSLGPSTIYPDREWLAPTPSSHRHDHGSPSKLNIGDILINTPPKRRTSESKEDESTLPAKKLFTDDFLNDENELFSPVIKQVQVSPVKPPTGSAAQILGRLAAVAPKLAAQPKWIPHKGPIITDLQCNPCSQGIRDQILAVVEPATYETFFDHSSQDFNHFPQVRIYNDKLQRQKTSKSSPRKGLSEKSATKLMPPTLNFPSTSLVYAVKKELGKGAFAPVYLVDACEESKVQDENAAPQSQLRAIKAECPTATLSWEFHILHLLKSRLGPSARTMQSIVETYECHLFRDECYLVLAYHEQGTILDLVNLVRSDNIRSGKTAEGLEEPVVMWLSVELLRCMEELHKVGILHGDLKADNCLVRLDSEVELTSSYDRHGHGGWSSKGMTLIDFGRGIDIKAFKPETRFVADWAAESTDCPEIRDARPWKHEIDVFGAAGVIHSLLFGKYIDTVVAGGGGLGQKKEYKLHEPFKRYWEKDIWTEVFGVLINSGGKKEDEVRQDISRARGLMETWLENESEKNGRDLRAGIRRCERLVNAAAKGRK